MNGRVEGLRNHQRGNNGPVRALVLLIRACAEETAGIGVSEGEESRTWGKLDL